MYYRLAILGLLVAGQSLATVPDPSDSKAAVPALDYRSAFDSYRRHTDVKVESWKAMNDNVGRIGGWRVYLKEAQQPDTLPAVPAAQPKPVASPAQHAH